MNWWKCLNQDDNLMHQVLNVLVSWLPNSNMWCATKTKMSHCQWWILLSLFTLLHCSPSFSVSSLCSPFPQSPLCSPSLILSTLPTFSPSRSFFQVINLIFLFVALCFSSPLLSSRLLLKTNKKKKKDFLFPS